MLLEVLLRSADFRFGGRDEIEEPLDQALKAAEAGEVTGGGAGSGMLIIDVEVVDLQKALAVMRPVLRDLRVAPGTLIRQPLPIERFHKVYE
jgi:hypothetical protein